ncbi:thiamine pyrophosphate-binding protein [Paeniglutamicibacter sulfureus]|uniref:Thiamine pyrophosphate-dependent acetolactate synthase large subunit-like protein n=1 Tax=Paeniglutamicibacter sulfureus TaxID=43666 RepID=A0ABU2BI31_9MICC|nr:thiamine pyrophosphate-binding protein [Paeniglutamicibacter sulfureus]MDR7358306.1 thiamine pyrophosphate-dependent acetolactate synthase large subunit-like protein [Paeniglutamicibacter sulfureus]
MSTVSAAVSRALLTCTSEIFGVMGNGNAHFLDAALRTGFRFTAVRHESAAVTAADAYFRITGKPAIATTTYGAGFSNAITPLAEAAKARIPMVLVTGDQPSTGARPWDIDQGAINDAVGATTFVVDAQRPMAIAFEAVAHALRERTAVVLSIPYDIVADEAAEEGPLSLGDFALDPGYPAAAPELLTQAAAALNEARRPLVLYGRGARLSGAAQAITALADSLGALSSSTVLAPNLLADRHGDLGIAGGFSSGETAALIHEADVVLVLGAGLNQFTTRFGELFNVGAQVIQVDVAAAATSPRVDVFLRADVAAVADSLLPLVRGRHGGLRWVDEVGDRLARVNDHAPGDEAAPDGLLDPRSVARALNAIMPADRVVVQDGGHFIGWGPMYWDVPGPHALNLVGTAYQSIGLGLASAVGAGAASPESTIVLASGDGGFLMGLADLESVIRTVRSGIVVIYNDAAYGAEIHQYGSIGLHEGPMLIPEVDFAAVARGLGASATKVRSLEDLAGLRDWVAAGADGIHLVDCRISPDVRAPYMEEVLEANRKAAGVRG